MLRPFRKPLIIMTPKSLLRHKRAVSELEDFTDDNTFHRCLDDKLQLDEDGVTRLVFCSGKVYFDLLEAREKSGQTDTYVARIEQLYPFPADVVKAYAARFPNLKTLVWAQEEPKNAGAWSFVSPLIEDALGVRPVYAGRAAAASTATGLMRRHNAEQAKLIAEALGASRAGVTAAIRAGFKLSAGKDAAKSKAKAA
jgi:2-oxoglutarate dehydrogenase E1 component